MAAADRPNLKQWRDWRLATLVEQEKKEEKKKEEEVEDITPTIKRVPKPKTDNEGHRETVAILGKKFYLDDDNVTSKTGHTFSWIEIAALYEFGKEEKYIKE